MTGLRLVAALLAVGLISAACTASAGETATSAPTDTSTSVDPVPEIQPFTTFPPVTVAPATTMVPLTTPPNPAEEWARLPNIDAVFGGGRDQGMLDVVATEQGFFAVGYNRSNAAAWASPNGLEWTRSPHRRATLGGSGTQRMNAVTEGGAGFVAVGRDAGDAAVWTSNDGLEWQRVRGQHQAFGGEGHQVISDVTPGGPGLVAIGVDDGTPTVWTSTDGSEWDRVPHDEAVFGDLERFSLSAIASSDTVIVAVGSALTPDGLRMGGIVLTSSDGVDWQRTRVNPADANTSLGLTEVIEVDSGFIAVGSINAGAPVWTSPDGYGWITPVETNTAFQSGSSVDAVAANNTGIIAVGGDEIWGMTTWISDDGSVWKALGPPAVAGGARITAIAHVDSLHVAVGSGRGDFGEDAVVFIWYRGEE